MTYAARETSTYGAAPIELHRFQRGGTVQIWNYTSSVESVDFNGEAYDPVPINRTRLELSQDTIRNSITINLPTQSDFIQTFLTRAPSDIFNYSLFRYHEGDSETINLWSGRVINVSLKEEVADVLCESIITSLKRFLLKRLYQTTCPLTLYGNVCGANSADFLFETTVTGISGLTISGLNITDQPDGYYNGGYVEFSPGGITNRSPIITHVGNNLNIGSPLEGLVIGSAIRVFPGCDHTTNTCTNKFNNILNYGGFPWIPEKNPMSGTPIF